MAYAGTTSTDPNPPGLQAGGITGRQQWDYNSTHTQAEAAAAGFITDAKLLGMHYGDSILVMGSTTGVVSRHFINAVTSTGATMSAGLLVSSAS